MQLSVRTFFCAIILCTLSITQNGQSAETAYPTELGLEEFVKIALLHNPRIHGARNEMWAAEGRSTQAISAYLPQLSVSGQASRVHVKDLTPVDEDNVLTGTLTGDQLIFVLGKPVAPYQLPATRLTPQKPLLIQWGLILSFL